MIRNKKLLIGITGSIAAYKTILLVRLLKKEGAEVKVVMTPAAVDFVSPLVLSTLSQNEVLVNLTSGNEWSNHVMLGRWADLMIIAPASCNTIAKMAHGFCDNLLQAVYLSATCPVWIAPAMDEDMWKHPSTRQNIRSLKAFGNRIIEVGKGELASGLFGEGRMAEPDAILADIQAFFVQGPLDGARALVTAGPTYEAIDPVRFIGNHSSGKMGIAIAQALQSAGANTTLVLGPSVEAVPEGINIIRVQSANEMFEACKNLFPEMDIAVMSAAVADYRPKNAAVDKIKKADSPMHLELELNPDILKYCGSIKAANQILMGFALETSNEAENARKKLVSKNADFIVMNSLKDSDAGFGTSTNKVTIFERNGEVVDLPLQSKAELAEQLVQRIIIARHAIKG